MQLSLLAAYLQELLSSLYSFLPLTSRGSCKGEIPSCYPWEESNLAIFWGRINKPELICLSVCSSLPCRVPLLLCSLRGEFFPGLHGLPSFSGAAGGQVPPCVSWGDVQPRESLLLWVLLQLPCCTSSQARPGGHCSVALEMLAGFYEAVQVFSGENRIVQFQGMESPSNGREMYTWNHQLHADLLLRTVSPKIFCAWFQNGVPSLCAVEKPLQLTALKNKVLLLGKASNLERKTFPKVHYSIYSIYSAKEQLYK